MLKKKWKILVLNHSHTDIGYTDRQEKIERHHIEYIKEAINILNEAYENGKEEWQGYKWTCESFWCVERFLEEATEKELSDFIKYVKLGRIGLSLNYLNLTDLISDDVLRDVFNRTIDKLKGLGLSANCAMTADINGYSWGYSQALKDSGVNLLYSCIHTHHGMYPNGRKQYPFYWETPNGDKLLSWVGEHYHVGNELGFSQFNSWEFTIKDGLDSKDMGRYERAEKRIFNYLEKFEEEDFPFDFLPITVSALMTDNAPPSFKIIEFINRWNKEHGNEIKLEMAVLEDLLGNINRFKDSGLIPTYKGDWTDWWADGTASTPGAVKHYREGLRLYNLCKKLDPENELGEEKLMDEALNNFMMYSEHTWGYSASITEPWHTMVNNLDLRKQSFASKGHEAAARNLDKITYKLGETELKMWRDITFKVVNPHDEKRREVTKFFLEVLFGHENFEIVDKDTGKVYPHQIAMVPRGYEINVLIDLEPKEEKSLIFRDINGEKLKTTAGYTLTGSDGVKDLVDNRKDLIVTPNRLESPFFKIKFELEEGITEFIDKESGKNIQREDRVVNAFTPIYEVTPLKTDIANDRRLMGRNRKAYHSTRDFGKLINIKVLNDGDLFGRVELEYKVKGCSNYFVILTLYKDLPRVDVDCRVGKDNILNAENLYVALPFTMEEKEELYIDKTGCYLRPRIDQLPKSCVDFYAIQNGMVLEGEKESLAITSKDAHMIFMGDIKPHEINLCGDPGVINNDLVYSWVMNNYWETNFKASLGGFYEFNYSVFKVKGDAKKAFKEIINQNEGVVSFNRWD
ncbi:glycoside hydrolase [Clostridium perfringens]|nr:glycoside hydrolase [Clostridium perfringens]